MRSIVLSLFREVDGGLAVVAIHFQVFTEGAIPVKTKYLNTIVQLDKKGNPSLSPLLDSLQYILPSGKSAVTPYDGFQVNKQTAKWNEPQS